jgi:hypothetical protein
MPKNKIFKLASVLFFLTAGGCASLPDNTGKLESQAFGQPQSTTLGEKYAERSTAVNNAGREVC